MTIFARLLNFVLCFSLILISGCANTSTIKADAVRIKDKPLLIVPTGATKITGLSSSGGGAFGLLGVLIEHAATSDSRAKAESVANQAFPTSSINDVTNEAISQNIRLRAISSQVTFNVATLTKTEFVDWFNSDQRMDIQNISNPTQAFILDYGFQGISVTSSFGRRAAEGAFGIRIIEPTTGKVIARARVFAVGSQGGELINGEFSDENSPEYKAAIADAFKRLIRKLVVEALTKTFS